MVWPAADHPRCLDVERDNRRITNGDLRYVYNEPYCLGYDLAAEHDANHCEFHVDALGLAYEGHYGIPLRWMFAFVNVNGQEGTVENVGLLTRFFDEVTGADGVRFSLGRELEPGRWRVGFTYEKVVYQGSMTPAVRAQLRDFAFFLDVRRPDGAEEALADELARAVAAGREVILFSFTTLPEGCGRAHSYGIEEAELEHHWPHKLIVVADLEVVLMGNAARDPENRAVLTREGALVEMAVSNLVLDLTLWGQRFGQDTSQRGSIPLSHDKRCPQKGISFEITK